MSSEERSRKRLAEAQVQLQVIQDRIDSYVEAEKVPLEIHSNKLRLEREIAQLEKGISEKRSVEQTTAMRQVHLNEDERSSEIARLQVEVARLDQENQELRSAAARQADEETDTFDHVLIDVLRHANALARVLDCNYGRVYNRAQDLTSAIERAITSTHDHASIRALTQAYDLASTIANPRVRSRERTIAITMLIIVFLFAIAIVISSFIKIFNGNIFSNGLLSYIFSGIFLILFVIIFFILRKVTSLTRSRSHNLFKIILGIADTGLGATHPEVIHFENAIELWKQRVRESEDRK